MGLTARRDMAWNGDLGWVGTPSTGDVDLSAGDVPLRGTSDVQADLLDAEKVLDLKMRLKRGSSIITMTLSTGVKDALHRPEWKREGYRTRYSDRLERSRRG